MCGSFHGALVPLQDLFMAQSLTFSLLSSQSIEAGEGREGASDSSELASLHLALISPLGTGQRGKGT